MELPSRQTRSSDGPPYPLGRWSSEVGDVPEEVTVMRLLFYPAVIVEAHSSYPVLCKRNGSIAPSIARRRSCGTLY